MQARERAQKIVSKITQADRLGGGFLAYHSQVIDELTEVFEEHAAMKARCDELDRLQTLMVAP